MCGITGVLNLDGEPVSQRTLRNMTDMIVHRGPDGEGYFIDGALGFGHRRLSIIDLSPAGAQPMETPDGDLVITYNGEVYNFQELRTELQAKGHQFHSKTDTEVVLHAYQEWGPSCLERLNGMFAFAIWNKRTRELFLARDRYGIKPLYYVQIGDTLLFASEIKAFLKHPAFKVRVSLPHLLEYFTFQNIFTDGTLFDGVKLLPPGHYLRLPSGGEGAERVQWWDFDFEEVDEQKTHEEYVEELDRLFRQAVRRQLVSDVPVGSYLSGGMDSGSITAIAAQDLPHMCTFTGGFDLTHASGLELAFDERSKAEAFSYEFQTEHYEVVLKSGDMERCMEQLVWHLEDPRVGQSYPNYYVARLASKFVKVCLAGTGGDELFAGYPWRYYRATVNQDFDDYIEKYYGFWHRLIPNRYVMRLFHPPLWDQIKHLKTIDIFREVFRNHPRPPKRAEDYVNHSLYLEAKTFLHGLLVVDDKLSMAHSLETRVPFLDNDLVDFAQRIPTREKLRNLDEVIRLNENDPQEKSSSYFQKTKDGKLLLREAMMKHIPQEAAEQVKQGFSGPDATWFKGDSIEFVKEIVNSDRSRIYEYFDPATVREIVEQHTSGQQNRRLFIWSLLMFEYWIRLFDPEPPQTLSRPAGEATSARTE